MISAQPRLYINHCTGPVWFMQFDFDDAIEQGFFENNEGKRLNMMHNKKKLKIDN